MDEYDANEDIPSQFNPELTGFKLSGVPNGPGVPTNLGRSQQDYDGISHLGSQSKDVSAMVTPRLQYSTNVAGISRFND